MDGEALHHGKEEAKEGAEEPVVDEEVGQRDGQHEDALDEVGESQVAHQEEGLVVVQPPAAQHHQHGGVADDADDTDEGVDEHEERVDVAHGPADVELGVVHLPRAVVVHQPLQDHLNVRLL